MNFEYYRNPMNLERHFHFVFTQNDYFQLENLTEFDKMIIRECEESDLISDKLLALELMARRMEEAQNVQKTQT